MIMSPIQIRRPEVVEHIRQLAEITGLSITDAIEKAVDTQLMLEMGLAEQERAEQLRKADETLARIRKLPIVGPLLTDDDLYDEEGFPK
jgi:hypothetical protein